MVVSRTLSLFGGRSYLDAGCGKDDLDGRVTCHRPVGGLNDLNGGGFRRAGAGAGEHREQQTRDEAADRCPPPTPVRRLDRGGAGAGAGAPTY